jgi:hypothetical protein
MRSCIIVLAVALGAAEIAHADVRQSPAPAAQELPPIRNFLQVNKEFSTGGQPRLENF